MWLRDLLQPVRLFTGLFIALPVALLSQEPAAEVYTHPCMGTEFKFYLFPESGQDASKAVKAAIARIEAINRAASDYLPDSELSQINLAPPHTPIQLSPDLNALITKALKISSHTHGAFDITSVYSIQNWRRAKRQHKLPSADRIEHAIGMTDWQHLQIDSKTSALTKLKEGIKIDLGAIGKGYAAREALQVLREHHFTRALVAASGDLAIGDPPPGKKGWPVHLRTFEKTADQDSQITVLLSNCGCSTSGDLHQYFELEGKRWSHIIDPRTGLGLTQRVAVSVIGPESTICDALATALCIMGPEKAETIKDDSLFRDYSWRIVTLNADETVFKTHTKGPAFTIPDQP